MQMIQVLSSPNLSKSSLQKPDSPLPCEDTPVMGIIKLHHLTAKLLETRELVSFGRLAQVCVDERVLEAIWIGLSMETTKDYVLVLLSYVVSLCQEVCSEATSSLPSSKSMFSQPSYAEMYIYMR